MIIIIIIIIIIIFIIILFNVDAKNKVKNYILNDGHLLTQCWQGKYEILEMSKHPKTRAHTE